jgi:dephospho-CoA kinase
MSSAQRYLIIGMAGKIGAGKSEVSSRLSQRHGFDVSAYSDVIREYLADSQIAVDRASMQKAGQYLIDTRGVETLSELVLERMRGAKFVIDGIRHRRVVDYLRQRPGSLFKLVFVAASISTRLARVNSRRKFRGEGELTLQQLMELESDPTEVEVDSLMSLADVTIDTESALEDMRRSVDNWIVPLLQEMSEGGQDGSNN